MYKFIFIHDQTLEEEITCTVVAILRARFGYDISQSDFDGILDSCLEQIDEVFDIDF